MPVASAADKSCAPSPVAFEPEGPTQIATGTVALAMRLYKSRIVSRPTKEAFELICKTRACAPLVSASAIALLIASTMMLSIRPETCNTSTGAKSVAVTAALVVTAS